jgi:hemolysin activation/secretion protein
MRIVNGDNGYFVNLELVSPTLQPGWSKCYCDALQLLAFCDLGEASNHQLQTNEDPSVDLASVGVGLRYTLRPGWLLRAEYGHALSNLTANDPREGRVHIGAIMSF